MSAACGHSHPDPQWGSENRPRKAEAILATLRRHFGPEIACGLWVDIGCGSGEIAATLAPLVDQIAGIDPERWARWEDLAMQRHNLRFIHGSYEDASLILAPGSANVVICNQVYEHVHNPVALIQCIHRILKPGGHCYFAGPNLYFPIEPHVFWPFVHWLPRDVAVKLMRTCGAKNVVDANSVSYWMLRRWLKDFEIINAVPGVLRHPKDYGRKGVFWRAISYVPHPILDALTSLSPGFVLLLRKTSKPPP